MLIYIYSLLMRRELLEEIMKLEGLSIKRFRSIDILSLENVGKFNVLIGKNNSGKSNILSAIEAFFLTIKEGNIITLNPPIGKEIDFFDMITEEPISIKMAFHFEEDEMEQLVQDIIDYAPQMRNAAEDIRSSRYLLVTAHIEHSRKFKPSVFGYIGSIYLTNSANIIKNDSENLVPLLGIDENAARELRDRLALSSRNVAEGDTYLRILQSIDEDDWQQLKTEMVKPRSSSQRFIFSRYLSSEYGSRASMETVQNVTSIIEASKSYLEFRNEIERIIRQSKLEADHARESPLENSYISTFSGNSVEIPRYALNIVRRISEMSVLYLTERRKQIGEEEAQKLLSLKVLRGGGEALRTIQDTVSALLGVQIDAFQSDVRGAKSAELDVDNFLVQVNGSGIREALRLVLDYEFQKPRILLVEEPEVHLHPALETSMMRYLKKISSECQVIITTHSTNFLDTADISNVYLVSKGNSTEADLLNIEEIESEVPKELGVRLSSLFMFDRLVFVEGPSDEAVLREWASTLGYNLNQSNIGFVHMGGVRNFAHFATKSVLAFLTKRQVAMWFFMDRDERDDPEIDKFKARMKDLARVEFLHKREIENYLLHPRAIGEFIKQKKNYKLGETQPMIPDEAEIAAKLQTHADSLMQHVVDKRVAKSACVPAYPSMKNIFDGSTAPVTDKIEREIQAVIDKMKEIKESISALYKQETAAVESVWDQSKFDIVPGDALLDLVCQEYGVRFRKDKDSAKLASMMKVDEIHQDIERIIRDFVQ